MKRRRAQAQSPAARAGARRGEQADSARLHPAELIARKRDGGELKASEIAQLIEGFGDGRVADYQMTAFAMAVYLQGMSPAETAALTLAMRDSGRRADLARVDRPRVDKHSTGGVGDKVSICLAPLCAAAGLAVPMISGRGLGHTGGTLDKLESIPGFEVDLPLARFEQLVATHGLSLIGQTDDLAPADRRLYALRDVTATVSSIPLITASILSKKLCEDLDALVLDVKVGRGAFMKTLGDARELARSIVSVGRKAGTPTRALITRMDCPLGRAVGNALETEEAIRLLHGDAPADLLECTLSLGAEMLVAGKLERSRARAERRLQAAIADGSALSKLRSLIAAQGGDARVADEPDRLPRAAVVSALRAKVDGFVHSIDALAVAETCLRLGAGRLRAEDEIDPAVGVILRRKPGDAVKRGETLAELHCRERGQARAALGRLSAAYVIKARRPKLEPLIVEGFSS